MPSLSENMAFTVPEAVMRGSRGGREDSGGSLTRKVSQQVKIGLPCEFRSESVLHPGVRGCRGTAVEEYFSNIEAWR